MRVLAVGTIMVDVILAGLPRLADEGGLVYTNIETHIGGHPIDVAIDLVKLGEPAGSVAVAAAVGSGPYGMYARRVIDEYGIAAMFQDVAERDTGANLVLALDGQDRRLHLDPGANWFLDPGHVGAAIADWQPELFTFRPGYSGIDLALDEVLASLPDAIVLLDLMRPHPTRPPGYIAPALQRANIVHCNESEALANAAATTLPGAVAEFLEQGVELVLVTSADGGAAAYTSRWQVRQPAFRVAAVDETGCGDAFCAGVIRHIIHNRDQPPGSGDGAELTELLLTAQSSGAAAATAAGCVAGVSAATVAELLAAQGDQLRHQTQVTEHGGRQR
jgi:sugar/nucleoside kinase (ribokinase family)